MSLSRFPHGLSSFGIPVIGSGDLVTTGNVFFVDDSGSDAHSGTDPTQPFATIDYAIGKCTASQGDLIIVMPGHAETVTTAITCDVIGVRIVGLGQGRMRPAITPSGAIDAVNVTAASVTIENLRVIGAASCTALLNVSGADFTAKGCRFEPVATPVNVVTLASGAARATFDGCTWWSETNGPDYGILVEAGNCDSLTVVNSDMIFSASGLDNAAIGCSFIITNVLIDNCRFLGMDLAGVDFNSSATGLVDRITVAANSATLTVNEMFDVGHLAVGRAYMTTKTTSGAHIPATTATP